MMIRYVQSQLQNPLPTPDYFRQYAAILLSGWYLSAVAIYLSPLPLFNPVIMRNVVSMPTSRLPYSQDYQHFVQTFDLRQQPSKACENAGFGLSNLYQASLVYP